MKYAKLSPVILAITFLAACAGGGAGGKYASPSEWVAESKNGGNLILAESADVWSAGKIYNKGTDGEVQVKSRFVKHFGTTCVFDLEFTNTGSKTFKEGVTLVRPDQQGQYYHNTVDLKMKPGQSYTVSAMELRECSLQWGESKDLNACATCGPRLGFMNKW